MSKQKYLTEYPTILKKKAKKAGVKIKKADCRFLDYLMFYLEEAEYPEVKFELMEESEEVLINLTTHMGIAIHMQMDAHDAYKVTFKTIAASIPEKLVNSVGRSIFTGSFIDKYLALQITLENLEKTYADIVMEGQLRINGPGEEAVVSCGCYLLLFIEQINQINHVLTETGYGVRLLDCEVHKVKAIKMVRELTGWGLKEAKGFVDAAPNSVLKVESKDEAMYYVSEFEGIGVEAEIV